MKLTTLRLEFVNFHCFFIISFDEAGAFLFMFQKKSNFIEESLYIHPIFSYRFSFRVGAMMIKRSLKLILVLYIYRSVESLEEEEVFLRVVEFCLFLMSCQLYRGLICFNIWHEIFLESLKKLATSPLAIACTHQNKEKS